MGPENAEEPGITVNPVNTQYSNPDRLSWQKRDEIIACLNRCGIIRPTRKVGKVIKPKKYNRLQGRNEIDYKAED